MSISQPTQPERIDSPLASNNPFRSRIGSTPAVFSTRPVSRNPFLDISEVPHESESIKSGTVNTNTELLADLSIGGKPNSPIRQGSPMINGEKSRENMPPRPKGRGPPAGYRPSTTEEERKRQQSGKPPTKLGQLDIFADPPELARVKRYPRRNSESSVKDKPNGLLDAEEEKRRREKKIRESKKPGKPRLPSKRLDLIDKLDVTSIYGTGLFHHDGPFDACNPHRNRKNSRQAPMQAFPKDSLNMRLGGAAPVESKFDIDLYHGRGQEAHIDFNEAAVVDEDVEYFRKPAIDRNQSFNPTARFEPVHGDETIGLGTSTFLDGAPASRAAIQRRESENEAAQIATTQSLSRKKSIAQKIRSVRPNRVTSPEPLPTPTSPLGTARSETNANPFFKDYDVDYDKKGAQIAFAADEPKIGRARAPSSPRRGLGLERRATQDAMSPDEAKPSGFLNRVKSLKGPRRARPERRETAA